MYSVAFPETQSTVLPEHVSTLKSNTFRVSPVENGDNQVQSTAPSVPLPLVLILVEFCTGAEQDGIGTGSVTQRRYDCLISSPVRSK